VEPFHVSTLKVSPTHELYYEESGNPKGKPVVFFHGGPGGGVAPMNRQFFDPQTYRIILFDQRGAGKSTPFASLEENTTWDLVSDAEKLREHLGIDKWLVFGGSWGSTFALAYSETHPESVKGLVLRGIFLMRRRELLWFYQEGASYVFPEAWEKFLEPIPPVERFDLMSAYHRRLSGPDPKIQQQCAKAWTTWEMATSRLFVDPQYLLRGEDEKFAVGFARIESHYFVNGGFFSSDNHLLENIHKITHLPATIVQGRYDMVCPTLGAWDLKKAWPSAELIIVPDAGHSGIEPGIAHALLEATDKYRTL